MAVIKNPPTKSQIKKALIITGGLVGKAAKSLGHSYSYIWSLITKYELKDFRNECMTETTDLAEQVIRERMLKDGHLAVKYLSLVTKAANLRDKRYDNTKIEVDKETGSVNVTVTSTEASDNLNKFLDDYEDIDEDTNGNN